MKKWCLLSLALSVATAQANTSAFDGLERIRATFGDQALSGIVEMTGTKGQPQPEDWWLLSYDPKGPFKLHHYWVDGRRATDEGFDDDVYRKGAPEGFIRFEKLKVDSTDIFRRADAEAMKAAVDFDRIDYRLRCREFSDDPLWTVRLYNRGAFVGKLDFSGSDGTMLRSIWLKTVGGNPRGPIALADSAFPGAAPLVVGGDPPATLPDPAVPEIPDPTVPTVPDTTLDPGLTPEPTQPAETDGYPVAIVVDGRPGYVRSPFSPDAGLVDVRDLESGTPAHCPYTGKIFRVP